MKKKSFDKYLKSKKIVLREWQKEAATEFLRHIEKQQNVRGPGKTFLLNVLTDFINEHGNYFELP